MLDDYIFLILLIVIYLLMITYVELKRKGRGLVPGIICGIVQVASLYFFDTINQKILALPALETYSKTQGTIFTIVLLFLVNVALIVLLNLLADVARKKQNESNNEESTEEAEEEAADDSKD